MSLGQLTKAGQLARSGHYPSKDLNKRECKLLEVAESYSPAVSSNFSPAVTTMSAALDQLAANNAGGIERSLAVVYDFSVNGGAVGTIPLSASLPNKAVVTEVIRDEVTALTSTGSTGTIILNVPTDGNLEQTALTADGGSPSLASSGGSALPKKTTAARTLQVTIATNPVLAGKINYIIRYFVSI